MKQPVIRRLAKAVFVVLVCVCAYVAGRLSLPEKRQLESGDGMSAMIYVAKASKPIKPNEKFANNNVVLHSVRADEVRKDDIRSLSDLKGEIAGVPIGQGTTIRSSMINGYDPKLWNRQVVSKRTIEVGERLDADCLEVQKNVAHKFAFTFRTINALKGCSAKIRIHKGVPIQNYMIAQHDKIQ